ncbi:MAG: hypothetical protein WKF30_16450 [Pyrinomonadaceae bacterium]
MKDFEKRASFGYAALLSVCQAINIAITIVLPEPVAIFAQRRSNARRPKEYRSTAAAVLPPIKVSTRWKKNRRWCRLIGLLLKRRVVITQRKALYYLQRFLRAIRARARMRLTNGIAINLPGSSTFFRRSDDVLAGRLPASRMKERSSEM